MSNAERPRVVVTGAAGAVGSGLWPRLRTRYDLCLFDRRPVADAPADVDVVVGDVNDAIALHAALDGAAAVVHLAGNPAATATWDELLEPNVIGVRALHQAAADLGVAKVVFASSCHASGRYDVEGYRDVDPAWPPRPCCLYGVTKVHGETVGRYYSDTAGTSVINLRLGQTAARPAGLDGLAVWLSFDDLGNIVDAALRADIRYATYLAASGNDRLPWSLEAARRELGYEPVDNAERLIDTIDLDVPPPPCYQGAVGTGSSTRVDTTSTAT